MGAQKDRLETGSPAKVQDWNELQFVPWQSFSRMMPSIVRLEITRLGNLIDLADSMSFRNSLVKVRYELEQFVEQVQSSNRASVDVETVHLEAAILNLPLDYPDLDPNTITTLEYILDRLKSLHHRIRFVYS